MNEYELAVMAKISTPQEEKNFIEEIKRLIEAIKGEAIEISELGKKRLSFPIKKQTEGNYWQISFRLSGSLPDTYPVQIKIMEPLLRHMIVKKEKVKAEIVSAQKTK